MTNDTRKVQLGAEFDASGVRKGTQEAKDAVRDMAREVQAQGQQAAKGLEGMGKGAEAAAQQTDRATKSLIGSIERATAALNAGQKGTAAYFEQLANARGVNADALRPYIEQLRQAERAQKVATDGLGAMGVSANQTRAALRQLPAQFTDIFASLSSGQAPLTVLIQQGGQIKDSFGGIGAALRGVASAVSPAAVGLGALLGGAVALAVAYKKGSEEADEYRRALVLTGNAAGTTVGALADMAAAVAKTTGTQGRAAEVVALLAGSGRVAAADIERFTEAAIRMERAGGPAAEKTAEAFAKLAESPVAASLKLNESTRFLTVGVLEQIRALEDQGRASEAARVAQQAYFTTVADRSGELERGLGSLERGWRNVADAAKWAWDRMLDIGRPQTAMQRLAEIQSELDSNRAAGLGRVNIYGGMGRNEALQNERGGINRGLLNKAETTSAQAAAAQLTEEYEKARKANERWADASLTNTQKVDKALSEYRRNLEKINEGRAAAGLPAISQQQVAAQEAAIRRQLGGVKELATEERKRAALLNELAGVNGDYIEQLQRLDALRKAGLVSEERYVDAVTALIQRQPYAVELSRQQAQASERRAKALREEEEAQRKQLEGLNKQRQAIKQQLQALDDEYIELTRGKRAREDAVLQREEEAAAIQLQVAGLRVIAENYSAEANAMYLMAQAQKDLVDARRRNTAQGRANETQDELRRQVVEAQKASDEWVADLRSGLVQTFRQAFLQGGNFGTNFAKGLAAEVKARLATALAEVLAGQALAAFGVAIAGGGSGGGSGAGNLMQGAGTLSNLYSLYSGSGGGYAGTLAAANYANVASGAAYGTSFGSQQSAMLAAQEAGMVNASTSAMASYLGYAALIYAAAQYGSQLYDKGFTGSAQLEGKAWYDFSFEKAKTDLLKGIGLSDKWAEILGGSVRLNHMFGRSAPQLTDTGVTGTLGQGGFAGEQYAIYTAKGGLFRSDKAQGFYQAPGSELQSLLGESAKRVYDEAFRYGQALGLPTAALEKVNTALKVSFGDDQQKNLEALQKALGDYATSLINAYGDSIQPLRRYGEDVVQTIARVSTAITGVNEVLRSIGASAIEASVQGGQAAVALQDIFGGQGGLQQAAGSYLQNFFGDAERQALTRQGIGRVLDDVGLAVPATRDAFRQLVQAQDLTTESGRQAFAALLSVSDAFASVTEAGRSAAEALAQREGLQDELDRLTGNDAAIAARERAKIDASNLDIYDALQRAKADQAAADAASEAARQAEEARLAQQQAWADAAAAAAEAADAARQAWQGALDSLAEESARLRGVSAANAGTGQLWAQFAIATGKARAGDIDAVRALPELSQQLSGRFGSEARTAEEAALMAARLAASLDQTRAEAAQAAAGTKVEIVWSPEAVQALIDLRSEQKRGADAMEAIAEGVVTIRTTS